MRKSTEKRIAFVQHILATYYEPERQDRNKAWVWRTKVEPILGISLRTFTRYINTPLGAECLLTF